jgi:signal transduction histidine kinase
MITMASILICRDDKSTLGMFCKLVEANPLIDEIYKAYTGHEAVRIIKDKFPDILILDIDLPDMDGIQVAKIDCDLIPEVAIAFVTGYPDFAAESFVVHPIFRISNNGPRIDEDDLGKIFQQGYSTREHETRGYGLYVAKKILDKCSGKIEVQSDRELTTFTVYLPGKTLKIMD